MPDLECLVSAAYLNHSFSFASLFHFFLSVVQPCALLLLPNIFIMDVPEPDQSPFTAVSAHTSRLTRVSVP